MSVHGLDHPNTVTSDSKKYEFKTSVSCHNVYTHLLYTVCRRQQRGLGRKGAVRRKGRKQDKEGLKRNIMEGKQEERNKRKVRRPGLHLGPQEKNAQEIREDRRGGEVNRGPGP